jgi:hypothetical protein
LAGDIARCVTDASDFYAVSFDPPHAAQADEYHDLSISVGKAELEARTSFGYYNQPVFYDEPQIPEKRLTVAELGQALEADHRERDRELASRLNRSELTERLSTEQLAKWKERLHGKQAKSVLTALGDQMFFLPLR